PFTFSLLTGRSGVVGFLVPLIFFLVDLYFFPRDADQLDIHPCERFDGGRATASVSLLYRFLHLISLSASLASVGVKLASDDQPSHATHVLPQVVLL